MEKAFPGDLMAVCWPGIAEVAFESEILLWTFRACVEIGTEELYTEIVSCAGRERGSLVESLSCLQQLRGVAAVGGIENHRRGSHGGSGGP